MDINAILYALGATGLFTSRAFVPAFFTALVLRFGDQLPYLKEVEFIQITGQEPMWLTSNWAIFALGALAALELLATKFPEAEEMLAEVHKYSKTVLAGLTTMGIFNASDAAYAEQMISHAGFAGTFFGIAAAGGVFFFTSIRNGVMAMLADADPDDNLGIRSLISWFEDLWGSFGVIILLVYPIVMAALILAAMGALVGLRKYFAYREEKSRVPCPKCQEPMYKSALACPSCKTPNEQPHMVGVLGNTIKKLVEDKKAHELKLVTKRRCPVCATRFEAKTPRQICSACGHDLFAETDFQDRYLGLIAGRLPLTLLVGAAFSLIPVIGLIPGIIYYNIATVAPFRNYIPAGQGFLLRMIVKLLFLVLVLLQVVPGVGVVVVPIMAIINYLVYRPIFGGKLKEAPATA